MSIIGISGKKQSGKNTVAKIIQLLCDDYVTDGEIEDYITQNKPYHNSKNWEVVAFADKLKYIVCLLTGCTREQLEDESFKNKFVGKEWIRYKVADKYYFSMDDAAEELEKYNPFEHIEVITPTYRELLQQIGTDLFRNQLHRNIWINATFADYKKINSEGYIDNNVFLPKWIISDMRFPNELEAVKERNGITIRVERDIEIDHIDGTSEGRFPNLHESETALDNAEFDYVVDNNATIDELIEQVKSILIKEQIL